MPFTPSQLIPAGQVDDAYDKLHAEHEEVKRNLEFAFQRTMVLVNMLGLSDAVVESPAVTGTILGMVRREVERLQQQTAESCIQIVKERDTENDAEATLSGYVFASSVVHAIKKKFGLAL